MEENTPVVDSAIHGQERKRIIQLHRLLEFDRAYSEYCRGEATAEQVKVRARKMIEAGLPESLK